jgi:hypothetical protein
MAQFPAEVAYLTKRLQYRLSRAAVQKGRGVNNGNNDNSLEAKKEKGGAEGSDAELEIDNCLREDNIDGGNSMPLCDPPLPSLKKNREAFEASSGNATNNNNCNANSNSLKKRKNNANDS